MRNRSFLYHPYQRCANWVIFGRLQTSEEMKTLRLNSGKNRVVDCSIVRGYSNSRVLQRDEVYTFAR